MSHKRPHLTFDSPASFCNQFGKNLPHFVNSDIPLNTTSSAISYAQTADHFLQTSKHFQTDSKYYVALIQSTQNSEGVVSSMRVYLPFGKSTLGRGTVYGLTNQFSDSQAEINVVDNGSRVEIQVEYLGGMPMAIQRCSESNGLISLQKNLIYSLEHDDILLVGYVMFTVEVVKSAKSTIVDNLSNVAQSNGGTFWPASFTKSRRTKPQTHADASTSQKRKSSKSKAPTTSPLSSSPISTSPVSTSSPLSSCSSSNSSDKNSSRSKKAKSVITSVQSPVDVSPMSSSPASSFPDVRNEVCQIPDHCPETVVVPIMINNENVVVEQTNNVMTCQESYPSLNEQSNQWIGEYSVIDEQLSNICSSYEQQQNVDLFSSSSDEEWQHFLTNN